MLLKSVPHSARNDLMSRPKRHAFHDQEVGQIRGTHKGVRRGLLRPIGVQNHGSDRQAQHAQGKTYIFEHLQKCFFIFLKVFVVTGG